MLARAYLYSAVLERGTAPDAERNGTVKNRGGRGILMFVITIAGPVLLPSSYNLSRMRFITARRGLSQRRRRCSRSMDAFFLALGEI